MLAVVLGLSGQVAWSQVQAEGTAPATYATDAPSEVLKPSAPVVAFLNPDESSGTELGKVCFIGGKKLPYGALVVVVQVRPCTRYSLTERYYEVLFGKETYYTPLDALTAVKGNLDDVVARSTQTINDSSESWGEYAQQLWMTQANSAMDALKATSVQGVAIVSAGLFDMSEHTEGTGFRITVANTGKKTIKYITVNLVGLNAVKDPVRDRYSRSTQASIRGVGPIAPDESASYSKDYLWMTDLVEDFTIKSIKLDFMDGTNRTVSSTKKLWLSREAAAMIFERD